MNNLADNLKRIRKENNLSQEQLAEKLGVSRQAVSKWESAQSYPEMDKVLQICSLFNLNINELINENVKEVNEIKEAKKTSNKYITSFFDYLTKVVDMFSSMKFTQIVKCLFEQCIIALILLCFFGIIGSIAYGVVPSVLTRMLPYSVYNFFSGILLSIYTIASLVFGIAILLHIFKIRYLDYYEFVKVDKKPHNKVLESEEDSEENTDDKNIVENTKENKQKIVLEKRPETVVIRDPKHSEFKFLSGLGKLVLIIAKFFVSWFLLFFALGFVGMVLCLALGFIFVKTGILFVGYLLAMVGAIAIMGIIINIMYNFIFSKKNKSGIMFIIGIISLIVIGFGSGMMIVGFSEFDIAQKDVDTITDEYVFEMKDNLMIARYYNYYHTIEYVEENRRDVKVEVEHSKYFITDFEEEGGLIYIYNYVPDGEVMNMIRVFIDDFNNKKIVNYDSGQSIKVYASKENIEKMKNNRKEYFDDRDKILEELNKSRNEVSRLEIEADRLESVLESNDYVIVRDSNGRIVEIYKDRSAQEYPYN